MCYPRSVPENLAALFDVLQPRIEHFFHSPKFCAPKIAHIVEALIDSVESGLELANLGIEKGYYESN